MDGIKRDEIRGLMAKKGFNITSLAREVGVSRFTMSGFLNGKSPSYDLMRGIQCVLGMSSIQALDIFFEGDLRAAKVEVDRRGLDARN